MALHYSAAKSTLNVLFRNHSNHIKYYPLARQYTTIQFLLTANGLVAAEAAAL